MVLDNLHADAISDTDIIGIIYTNNPGNFDSHLAEVYEMIKSFKIGAKADLGLAEKDLAYEYGRCVFYDKLPLEECNKARPDGLSYRRSDIII